jgi:hypothetical protein
MLPKCSHEEEVHASLYTMRFMILLTTLVSRTVALTVTVIKHSNVGFCAMNISSEHSFGELLRYQTLDACEQQCSG